MKDLIYLSSPYTDKNPEVVKERFNLIVKAAAIFLLDRLFVISPIVHGHPMVEAACELPSDWKFWQEYCETILIKCKKLYIIQMPGWENSTGVKAEIEFALKYRIPVYGVDINSDDSYTITAFDKKAKMNDYANGYSRIDTPEPGELFLLGSQHNDKNTLVVANKNFLGYSQIRVPFVKYNNEYYAASSLEAVPDGYSGTIASVRNYIKVTDVSDADFNITNSFYVYQL